LILLRPWWLLILPVGWALVLVVARRGRRTVPRRQHRWATWLRLSGVTLLVLALAHPVAARVVRERSVLFLLDRSASVSPAGRALQDLFVAEAIGQAPAEARSGTAVFAREMRMDVALAPGRVPQQVRTVVDESGTDIAAALRGAVAVLPSEGSRRVVLVTDGAETSGDARAAARELAELGVVVDVVSLESRRGPDALIEGMEAPTAAREGELVPVTVVVRSNQSGEATLSVRAGEGEPERVEVDLRPGRNEVRVEVPAGETGVMRISAELEAPFDEVPENDRGEAVVRVLGPARLALVEGHPGEAESLAAALRAGGMVVEVMSRLPPGEELLGFDAVVLVNLPAPPAPDTERLAQFVEELGRGLVVVGGDQAYGLGNYQETAFEELLPVRSNPDDLVRRQPVAEVLVIDTSGSMGRCHCREGRQTFMQEGGINKTDISKAGAALAIEALSPTDRVGVLAFTSSSNWVIPLQNVPPPGQVEEALGTLAAEGNTEIAQALRSALEELRDAPESLRHIVLFTDGWDPDDSNLLTVSQEIADAGITLSVLATGEGAATTLSRMAAVGGGRFYPGTDLAAVPEVFVEETLRVARNLVAEGSFSPLLGAASQVTAGLTAAPPLRGYVVTTGKSAAQSPLQIGPEDPLLATWQRGLGRVTAWTSDATNRWSADWLPWEGYQEFWGRVVGDVLPAGRETPPGVTLSGGELSVRFEAPNVPLDATGLARVVDPNGQVSAVPLRRTGESSFEGEMRVGAPGAYWVAVIVEASGAVLASGSSGTVSSYSEEFAFRDPDPALVGDVTALTSGRVDPDPGAVFDAAPVQGRARRALWPWLVAGALVLFLTDVGLRRLVVARGDLSRWREALVRRRRKAVEAVDIEAREGREAIPEEQSLGRLLRRKRR
jgi:Mg-chelatase subunit ChlD